MFEIDKNARRLSQSEKQQYLEDGYVTGLPVFSENAIKDIQKLDRDSFKVNCNKMLTDFDRNNIAENLIKFIV